MKRDRKFFWYAAGTLAVIGVVAWIGVEYGRYMYMAPDGMDFGTFVWIETLRR